MVAVVTSDEAKQDVILQSRWYLMRAEVAVADRYLAAFKDVLALLTVQPGIGTARKFRHGSLKNLRATPLQGAFRVHLVFYRMEGDSLVIFRVMHGMRDLSRRLRETPGL